MPKSRGQFLLSVGALRKILGASSITVAVLNKEVERNIGNIRFLVGGILPGAENAVLLYNKGVVGKNEFVLENRVDIENKEPSRL